MNHFRGYVSGFANRCRRGRLMSVGTGIEISEDHRSIYIRDMTGLVFENGSIRIAGPGCMWERVDSESISVGWQINNEEVELEWEEVQRVLGQAP